MTKPWTIALDLVIVVLFAVIGRSSHAEGLTLAGVWQTAWPFLVAGFLGAGIGWFLMRVSWLLSGLICTLVTVAGGMLLRVTFGGGFALTFFAVALTFFAVCFLGWRAIWHLVDRRRRARA